MYYLMMKTLIRPQAKLTIARSRDHIYSDMLISNPGFAKRIKSKLPLLLAFLSLSILLLFPETPQNNSEICNKNYAEKICNIW